MKGGYISHVTGDHPFEDAKLFYHFSGREMNKGEKGDKSYVTARLLYKSLRVLQDKEYVFPSFEATLPWIPVLVYLNQQLFSALLFLFYFFLLLLLLLLLVPYGRLAEHSQ